MSNEPEPSANPRRRWPWFVLAALLLGAVLAFLWVNAEVRRIKRVERFDYRPAVTNAPTERGIHSAPPRTDLQVTNANP